MRRSRSLWRSVGYACLVWCLGSLCLAVQSSLCGYASETLMVFFCVSVLPTLLVHTDNRMRKTLMVLSVGTILIQIGFFTLGVLMFPGIFDKALTEIFSLTCGMFGLDVMCISLGAFALNKKNIAEGMELGKVIKNAYDSGEATIVLFIFMFGGYISSVYRMYLVNNINIFELDNKLKWPIIVFVIVGVISCFTTIMTMESVKSEALEQAIQSVNLEDDEEDDVDAI